MPRPVHGRAPIGFRLVERGDPAFDAACRLFNGRIAARPLAIARCETVDEVRAAVAWAGGMPLAVRAGGHDPLGRSLPEDGVVIDVGGLRSLEIDPAVRSVRVGAGVSWSALDAATTAVGLATTGGACGSVSVVGLTLAGGFGFLARSRGLSCDRARAFEIVDRAGRVSRVHDAHEPDWFWMLRGGGAPPCVVTHVELALDPIDVVAVLTATWPLDRARDVLPALLERGADAPHPLGLGIACRHARDAWVLDLFASFDGSMDAARPAFEALVRDTGPRRTWSRPMHYLAMQRTLDEGVVPGERAVWRHRLGHTVDAGAVVDALARAPTLGCRIAFELLGGVIAEVPASSTAFAHRDASFATTVLGIGAREEQDAALERWATQTIDSIGIETARYAGYGGGFDEATFGGNVDRLASLRRRLGGTDDGRSQGR